MSYILDALKKAEQEREQGAVPGLHAQQALLTDADAPRAGLSPLVWAGVGVALTLAGVLSWHNWPQTPLPSPSPSPSPSFQPGLVSPGAVNAATAGQGGSPGQRVRQGTEPQAPPGRRASPSTSASAGAGTQDAASVAMQVEGAPGGSRPWPAQPTLSVPAAQGGRNADAALNPRPSQAEANAALPLLSELPEAVRRELPVLNVGGAMHSAVQAQRMLVLNGQVLHEGDSPHPGLQLEEIRLKSAVMNFKGQRFEVRF